MVTDRDRAIVAAMEVAAGLDLRVETALVLHESNRLAVRLQPCGVLARVREAQFKPGAEFEIGLARALAEARAPIGVLAPGVAPEAYVHDGFVVTLWTHYETEPTPSLDPADYARALERLHASMRTVELATPHFTYRISEALRLVDDRDLTPELADADRELLGATLQRLRQSIGACGRSEQLLHGEPHPHNLLRTSEGPLFIDLETCCRGPVEFDLAHVPDEVSAQYAGADPALHRDCQLLMLAMVATWRWDRNDQFPNGRQAGRDYVAALRTALAGGPISMPGF